jgi:NTP pyrophosphatase (non-canonical NTP hydrolase)
MEIQMNGDNFIKKYESLVKKTCQIEKNRFDYALLGLYGEIGSLLSISKRKIKEEALSEIPKVTELEIEEELGDIFWYFTLSCIRANLNLDKLVKETSKIMYRKKYLKKFEPKYLPLIVERKSISNHSNFKNYLLFNLHKKSLNLKTKKKTDYINFLAAFWRILFFVKYDFEKIINSNSKKIKNDNFSWNVIKSDYPKIQKKFDEGFPEDERFPDKIKIVFVQRSSGRIHMKYGDVFLGDPLTDNHRDKDNYRYHDIFHISYAAILHWSPVFRALLKRKRKSKPYFDENEDSGRAIVVEEGISAWIFNQAKEYNYFKNKRDISTKLIKSVQLFVKGYEVESCPPALWKKAIYDGFKVFRKLTKHKVGVIKIDLTQRFIKFEKLINE